MLWTAGEAGVPGGNPHIEEKNANPKEMQLNQMTDFLKWVLLINP